MLADSISSKSTSLQDPHERTSLLDSNVVNSATAHRQGIQLPRHVDEEATAVSESIHGKADAKPATGIFGVISLLLLGAYAARALSQVLAILHKGDFLFTVPSRVQVSSSPTSTSRLFLQRTARSHQNLIALRMRAGSW